MKQLENIPGQETSSGVPSSRKALSFFAAVAFSSIFRKLQVPPIDSETTIAGARPEPLIRPALPTFDTEICGLTKKEDTETSDLANLRCRDALLFARNLKIVLEESGFDKLNQLIRSDYSFSPLPLFSTKTIPQDLRILEPTHLRSTEADLIRVFLLGEQIPLKRLQAALKDKDLQLIANGLRLEIFSIDKEDNISLNNLLLCTHKLANDKVVYSFADKPLYMDPGSKQSDRVYLGIDSYYLNAKLQALQSIKGCAVEYGSGSGLQMITMALCHPELTNVYGLEIDARARNVSIFNSYLNGVEDKIDVAADIRGLRTLLGNKPVNVAFSNPPFISAPHQIAIPELQTEVDISQALSCAGWGGEDGLFHTRRFFKIIFPHLTEESQVIIYSQFAGDAAAPTVISECRTDYGFSGYKFERFPVAASNLEVNLDSRQFSEYLARTLKSRHPKLNPAVAAALEKSALELFQRKGFLKFHSGFVTLSTTAQMPTESTEALAASEADLKLYNCAKNLPAWPILKLRRFPGSTLIPPEDLGSLSYVPGHLPDKPVKITQELFRKKLLGEYLLIAGEDQGEFKFIIQDATGSVCEADAVYDRDGQLSPRYQEILKSIKVIETEDILRESVLEFIEEMPAEELPQSTFLNQRPGIVMLDELPLSHKIVISGTLEGKSPLGLKSLAERITLAVIPCTDPNFLKILLAAKIYKEKPDDGKSISLEETEFPSIRLHSRAPRRFNIAISPTMLEKLVDWKNKL